MKTGKYPVNETKGVDSDDKSQPAFISKPFGEPTRGRCDEDGLFGSDLVASSFTAAPK